MTSLSREQVQDLLPLYVMEEVSEVERAQIEQVLSNDPDLAAQADQWREDCGRMLEASTPPMLLSDGQVAELRDRMMRALPVDPPAAAEVSDRVAPVLTEPAASGADSGAGWWMPLAMAASVLSLAVAFWAVSDRMPRAELESELEAMRAERAQLADELIELRTALERTDGEVERVSLSLKTFGYPRSGPIVLAGLDAAPEATGATFYRPSSNQAVFYAYGLPPLDPNTIYQLWYITGDGPVSAGTFDVDRFGEGEQYVGDLPERDNIQLWAVTVEPASGSVSPTGPMLIRG